VTTAAVLCEEIQMPEQTEDGAPAESRTLTVEEAAHILRIGRTAAYALAREFRATNGRSGLPVLELGRTLRVPRSALDRMLELRTDAGTEVA
jgi:excisionase family DNA binding protein